MSSIFGENLLDDFLDYSFGSCKTFDMMDAGIKDTENGYGITMNMPGVEKEDIRAEPKGGYLTIWVATDLSKDRKDSNGTYIRRKRYTGSYSRSSYAGDAVTREDIEVKFEGGVLKMLVPKKEAEPAMEEKEYIAVEG